MILSPTLDVNVILSAATQLVGLPVPIGENWRVTMNVRAYNPSSSPNIYLRNPDCCDRPPSWTSGPLGVGLGMANVSMMSGYEVITDKHGRIAASALSSGTSCLISVTGWEQVDLPKRLSIETELIAPGGRIDAVSDFGGSLFAASRPGTSSSAQGKVYKKTGSTWALNASLTSTQGITCLFSGTSAGHGFALGHLSDLWSTVDDGGSWSFVGRVSGRTAPPNLALSYSGCVLPSGTVLMASSAGYVYRKDTSSSSFSEIFVDGAGVYRLMKVADGVIGNTWSGKVVKSVDDGLTWSVVATLSSGPLYAIEYCGDGRVLIGSASGKIYESFDNGGSFTHIQSLDGEADDFCSFGGVDLYSTYTSQKSIYLKSDEAGFRSMASLPSGDWLDHTISTVIGGVPVAIGGTSQGYIATITLADAS